MKNNKILRTISVFLILTAFAGMSIASSCGSDEDMDETTKAISDSTTSSNYDDDEDLAIDSDIESTTAETSETTKAADTFTTIDEQVILDEKGLKITAKEYVTDLIFSDSVKLEIENKTKKDLTVGCRGLIVNGYMITDLFAQDVSAGSKSICEVSLFSSELRAAGIEKVGEIEMYFAAYDDNYKNLFKKPKHTVIKTSNYDTMDTKTKIEGKEIYNKKGIKIIAQYVDENSFWGAAIVLYIENNSKKHVTISLDNMSVNGYMVDGLMVSDIYPNRKAIESLTIFGTDLKESDIESIDDIEIKLNIYDSDSYKKIDKPKIKFSTKE